MNEKLTVYTIGHSNLPAGKLIGLLQQAQIEVLVDVRSSPYSQYHPHFNREVLQVRLKENGIDYQYAGERLGGRPKDPACYKDGRLPDGKADYLHLVDYKKVMQMDWFNEGLDRLIELASKKRTAILCSEEDPAHCHRHHLIGKALLQRGVEVLHIRSDGTVVRANQIPHLKNEPPARQLDLFDPEGLP